MQSLKKKIRTRQYVERDASTESSARFTAQIHVRAKLWEELELPVISKLNNKARRKVDAKPKR